MDAIIKAAKFASDVAATVKYYWKRIDWTVVQVIVLVGMLPAMLIFGALFFPLFSAKYR